MINRKTVIITGAGSNRRAGFPLAYELKAVILNFAGNINENNEIPANIINAAELSAIDGKSLFTTEELKLLKTVASRLKRSSAGTLDDFLQRESDEINKIIKKFVAIYLVKAEQKSLNNGGIFFDNDWLALTLRRYGSKNDLFTDPLSVFNENLTIITFNYDLYLEFRVWETLRNDFNLAHEVDRAKELINKIKIIHPHGRVGSLYSSIGPDNTIVRDYGDPTFLKDNLDKVVNTFIGSPLNPEAKKMEEYYQDANIAILNADKVLFIGFGYHRTVMERLFPGINSLQEQDHDNKFFGSYYRSSSPSDVYPFIKGHQVSGDIDSVDYASFVNEYLE